MLENAQRVYSGVVDLSARNCPSTKIVELIGHGRRVLDVGCGDGYLAAFLTQSRGGRVVGIECEPEAAAMARRSCETVVVGKVEEGVLSAVSGPFDVIVFADVLEHLQEPGEALRAVRPLLAGGGYLLLSLPNVVHWEVRRAVIAGRFEYTKTGLLDRSHLRFFTYATAVRLIEASHFRIDHFDVVHRWPRHWRYGAAYRGCERLLTSLTRRYFKGLFGYQFIFRAVPAEREHEDGTSR